MKCKNAFSLLTIGLLLQLILTGLATAQDTPVTTTIIAGGGFLDPDTDIVPGTTLATDVRLDGTVGLYVDSSETLYVPNGSGGVGRINTVDVDGKILRFAGIGDGADALPAEGTPALDSGFRWPIDIVKDDDGNVYFSAWTPHFSRGRIFKVDITGNIFTFAGGGTSFAGTGSISATSVQLFEPRALKYRNGYLFLTEWNTGRISRIELASGMISTYAGSTDQVPRTTAQTAQPIPDPNNPPDALGFEIGNATDIAFDSNGTLYFNAGTSAYVRKVTPDGKLHDVATPNGTILVGSGNAVGQPASDLKMDNLASGIAVDALDNVYFPLTPNRLVIVGTDGIVSHVLHMDYQSRQAMEVSPNGNIYFAEGGRVRRIGAVIPPTPPNSAPTASAGADQSIRAGDPVNLDGGTSFDDNTASLDLQYAWAFFSKPGGSTATLVDPDTATPNFVADVAGTYVVELVVTDEGSLSSLADSVEISSDNMAPTADASVDFGLAIVGATSNFDGSGSSDPEDDPLTYSWEITAAPAASTAMLVGDNTVTPSLTTDVEGTYQVSLTVSDFLGPGAATSIDVTATTASAFAEGLIVQASDQAAALNNGQVTTKGNQNAFGNFLAQAISKIQTGDIAGAIDKVNKAIARTDGCFLRGSVDGNGQGRDWITDCDAQLSIYDLLTRAVAALQT